MSAEETGLVKIALISCGSEYSGVQPEFEEAASKVNAKFIYPEISSAKIHCSASAATGRMFGYDVASGKMKLMLVREKYYTASTGSTSISGDFGLDVSSGDLELMMARAKVIVESKTKVDGVFITTCFRCAEGAIVRNEIRRYIHKHSNIPVISYSFTERTSAGTLLTRLEALATIVRRRHLLTRETQRGLTAGIDSGSTTTKAVVMRNNKIIGKGWVPTTKVLESAEKAYSLALREAGVFREEIQALGTTGYGRFLVGDHFKAHLIQEEITVNSKGAVYLANRQKGSATVIDIGGMDNKAISVEDGIPGMFTLGGICAGASGRFFEMISKRLGVDIIELGALAVKGMQENVSMNSYCIVFGIQSLVNSLARGATPEDVAAAACYSVVEQIYEQQLQEVDVKEPLILVGGSSLIEGVPKALKKLLKLDVLVPENSHLIGAVGAALLASGVVEN